MRYLLPALACFILLSSGCASVHVTPTNLSAIPERCEERTAALQRWNEAVLLCNMFLESPERKTLPPGHVNFGAEGMEFVTDSVHLPIRVRCTSWSDVLIPFKMIAQERSDGFVVGLVQPKQSRLLDNSFFKQRNGKLLANAGMAQLILHELTHSYFRLGTVSFGRGISYYAESIFLFRYKNHSKERLPNQTSTEFGKFISRLRKSQSTSSTSSNAEPN